MALAAHIQEARELAESDAQWAVDTATAKLAHSEIAQGISYEPAVASEKYQIFRDAVSVG